MRPTPEGVHDQYFGQASDVDGNSRMLVLMTKEVNRRDLGGWVWFGDLYGRDQCASEQRRGDHVSLRSRTRTATTGMRYTKQRLLDYYPELLTHEVTHIIQGRYSGTSGRPTTRTWEIEGGATLAEQLAAYRLFGHGSGQGMGWAEYQAGQILVQRDWVIGHDEDSSAGIPAETGTAGFERAPEECTWIGTPSQGNSGPCQLGNRAIYGVPSMVLRYAMDRWGDDYRWRRTCDDAPPDAVAASMASRPWRM